MTTAAGADAIREWLARSPFVTALGLRLVRQADDVAEIAMPFTERLVTLGDVVHGGAIAALVDSAAAVAAWSSPAAAGAAWGATVSVTVNFVAAARGQDLVARARVARRGGALCFCDVDVATAGGDRVAQALVTYRLGGRESR
jgi:uncharacterized protein (TIGR00369 family)